MRNDFNIKPHDKQGYVFIAGTPRCGTQFIADTFQAIGIDIQHEVFGSQGISAFYIVPYLSTRKNGIILHQTREPLKVLASMQTAIPRTWKLIFNSMGIHPDQNGLLDAVMRLYLRLNSEIDKYHHFRYKVEDIDSVWGQLLDIINVKSQPLPDIPRDTHTRKGRFQPLSWAELEFADAELTKYICEMGHEYGY